MVKTPPAHLIAEGIVVHEPMGLGGARHHSIRGVAVGFDENSSLISKVDLEGLTATETKRLRALLLGIVATIDRGGAALH